MKPNTDPLERLLLALVKDWDKLERWALHNSMFMSARMAAEEKEKLLGMIKEINEARR